MSKPRSVSKAYSGSSTFLKSFFTFSIVSDVFSAIFITFLTEACVQLQNNT